MRTGLKFHVDPINNVSLGVIGQMGKLQAFIEKHFGKEARDYEVITDTDQSMVHLDIYKFDPSPTRNYITLVTAGMSYLPMLDGEDLCFRELVMCLDKHWNINGKSQNDHWPLAVLYNTARMPHREQTVIDYGHTIDYLDEFKKSFDEVDTNKLSGAEIMLGKLQLYPEDLVCRVKDNVKIQFMSVIPLYRRELMYMQSTYNTRADLSKACEFIKEQGVNELLDMNRESFIAL